LLRKKEGVEQKLLTVDKQHKQVLKEKHDLEVKIRNMSAHLQDVERKRQIMGKTIKEGSKSRALLRKKLNEARNIRTKAESAIKEKISFYESKFSAQSEEWMSKLAQVQAKFEAKLVEKNREHEDRIKELEGAIALQKVAFMANKLQANKSVIFITL